MGAYRLEDSVRGAGGVSDGWGVSPQTPQTGRSVGHTKSSLVRGRNAVLLANYVFVLLRDCSEVYLPHSFLGQESAAGVAVEPFF